MKPMQLKENLVSKFGPEHGTQGAADAFDCKDVTSYNLAQP